MNTPDKGERLAQLLDDTAYDGRKMIELILRGKVKGDDCDAYIQRIQELYQKELQKILN